MDTVETVNPPPKWEMMQGRTNVRRRAKGVPSVEVMHGEMVESELDLLLERHSLREISQLSPRSVQVGGPSHVPVATHFGD
jgi:hypothetical protein